jgi:hypothetical protein
MSRSKIRDPENRNSGVKRVDTAISVNGVRIRLSEERWTHIVENKPYMAAYYEKVLTAIEYPTWVAQGYAGALIAVLTLGNESI